MKGTTTLRMIIESNPDRRAVIQEGSDFTGMGEVERMISFYRRNISEIVIELKCAGGKLFVNEVVRSFERAGNRIFPKRRCINLIYVTSSTVKVKGADSMALLDSILSLFDITWTRDLKHGLKKYIIKSCIFKAVITGRVYSEETLVKRIASQIYRIRNVEWRVLKDYLCQEIQHKFSLYDLNAFTRDLNTSLKIITQIYADRADNNEMYWRIETIKDTLKNAVILGRVIDLKWSVKRMNQEHVKMTREIGLLDMKAKSEQPIHDEIVEADGIRMLNSEKEIFMEGMTMSHCIYTNYFRSIVRGQYLAFHMSYPEDCTIGVRCDKDGKPFLDQAYRFRNARCEDSTYDLIRSFIENKSDEIKRLLIPSEEFVF